MDALKKASVKKIFKEWLPVTLMVLCNLVFGIIFKQKFIKMLPVFISVIVMLLNSRASRYAFIIAGINCFIYSIGYAMTGVYGQVASALFQGVLAFISFFLWKKRAYGNSTIFRKLKNPHRILLLIGVLAVSAIVYLINSRLPDSSSPLIDSFTFVLGIVLTFLSMFAFIESPYMSIFSYLLSLCMWIDVIIKNGIQDITYLFSNVYSTYMVLLMTITWTKLYRKQQAEKSAGNKENDGVEDGKTEKA